MGQYQGMRARNRSRSAALIAPAAQLLLLRARRPGARGAVRRGYELLARLLSACLSRGEDRVSTYLGGGAASGEQFVPGLSDTDVVLVTPSSEGTPEGAAPRLRARWRALRRRLPLLDLLIDNAIYDAGELSDLAGASTFGYGLDSGGDPAARGSCYFGRDASLDRVRLLERPGLHGEISGWRLIGGPERRPPQPPRGAQLRREAAWLELGFWWRFMFPWCGRGDSPRTADVAVKLLAECARIWLWVAHGERAPSRAEALRLGASELPGEEAALRHALELQPRLQLRPDPALALMLPAALRISRRIAERLAEEVGDGSMTVRLRGTNAEDLIVPHHAPSAGGQLARPLPLADWRAVVAPVGPLDPCFVPLEGEAGDPAAIASATAAYPSGPHPALRAEGVMLMPVLTLRRGALRAIKSPLTDPVVFALADGNGEAVFPAASGWSAPGTASRAVAEHAEWLRAGTGLVPEYGAEAGPGTELGLLLTAARAARGWESVHEGDPELCVTVAAAARRLAERDGAARAALEAALERYRRFAVEGVEPRGETVAAMRSVVAAMPAYRLRR